MTFDEMRILTLEKQVKSLFTKFCCCTDGGGGGGGSVSSVFGRTGVVIPVAGDYSSSLVTEGSNLYFTNARARQALTLTVNNTSGPATYNSSTGILNIPIYDTSGGGGSPTLKTINSTSLLGSGNITLQVPLVSGTNIKTVGGVSLLGSGDIPVSGLGDVTLTGTQTLTNKTLTTPVIATILNGAATLTMPSTTGTLALTSQITGTNSGTNTGDQTITLTGDITGSGTGSFATVIGAGKVTNAMLAGSIAFSKLVGSDITLAQSQITGLVAALAAKQDNLVSGTTIKTINSASILGSGDIPLQVPLVSGINIKTVNSTSILGSGNLAVQPTLVSGTNIKTVGGVSILGSGDIALPASTETTVITTSTDNLPAVVATVTPTASSTEIIEIEVLTYSKLTTGVGAYMSKKYNVYEFNAGVLTELDSGVGTVDLIANRYSTGLSSASTSLAISANTIQIKFAGEASKTIKNSFTYTVRKTTF